MWYLFGMDEGVKEVGKTKGEITKYYRCTRVGKGDYEVYDEENFHIGYLHHGKEKAIANGWQWALDEYEEGLQNE